MPKVDPAKRDEAMAHMVKDDTNWRFKFKHIVYLDGIFVPISKIVAVSEVDIDDGYLANLPKDKSASDVIDELYKRKKGKETDDGGIEVPFTFSIYVGDAIHVYSGEPPGRIPINRETHKEAEKDHRELLKRIEKYYDELCQKG